MDRSAWDDAFARYRQTPQFNALKPTMDLGEFKRIYFWEWLHRLWGRLVGVAFAVPFAVFLARGELRGHGARLAALLVAGGLQGALGWYMVASGLSERVYVSHLRLAAHFIVALGLFATLVWHGLALAGRGDGRAGARADAPSPSAAAATLALGAALGAQFVLGALSAGLKSALAAPTWPTLNGRWAVSLAGDFWNRPLAVQFAHRAVAVALLLGTIAWWRAARRRAPREAALVAGLMGFQALLGVLVVLRAPLTGELLLFGALHQGCAVALAAALTAAALRLKVAPAT
jgi:cytochrome c oxidase assembly protein subunit 15